MPLLLREEKYLDFINKHSRALNELKAIDARYVFFSIRNHDVRNTYDIKELYDKVSPFDYLVYHLSQIKQEVEVTIDNVLDNQNKYELYAEEIKHLSRPGVFDEKHDGLKYEKLLNMEKREIAAYTLRPVTEFTLTVELVYTTYKFIFVESKVETFDIKTMLDVLQRSEDRNGYFYFDKEIWRSMCIVERGKVTNRLRRYVFKRDGRRCLKCGSEENLEVDYIIPIAYGGKSTFDNLQTLCHACHVRRIYRKRKRRDK